MSKTIKEIAEEIGVSKQAVFKKIKREPLSTSLQGLMTTVDCRLMVSVDGEKLIKQAFSRNISTITDNQLTGVDDLVDAPTTNNNWLSGEVDGLVNGVISVLQATIDTLQGQLSVKDKQIEELNARLAEVSSALVVAQQTAQAAQALHAGTIQQQLTDGDNDQDTHSQEQKEAEEKKGWLSRLLGR